MQKKSSIALFHSATSASLLLFIHEQHNLLNQAQSQEQNCFAFVQLKFNIIQKFNEKKRKIRVTHLLLWHFWCWNKKRRPKSNKFRNPQKLFAHGSPLSYVRPNNGHLYQKQHLQFIFSCFSCSSMLSTYEKQANDNNISINNKFNSWVSKYTQIIDKYSIKH